MKNVYIVAARRTPIGGFMGSLSGFTATQLGAIAIKGAFEQLPITASETDAVYFGHVLTANAGQSPARQASRLAGIPDSTDCTTINKVCASGMKAVMLGAQQIQTDNNNLVVAGGMESMSNAPHYTQLRKQVKLGDSNLVDGILKDGLTDAYSGLHMGNAAELCVRKYNLSRIEQDEYALRSYALAAAANENGITAREIVPVSIPSKNGNTMFTTDEDIYKVVPEKVALLKPVFEKDGTITAANASNLNDGAAALVLASDEAVKKYGLTPLARIVSYADGATEPDWFTIAPGLAMAEALKRAGLIYSDVDLFEINEAYAAVILANSRISGIDIGKINIYGGAVAMGHPIGASGARIICTLINALKTENKRYGMASICNGGGGSSAILIENLN